MIAENLNKGLTVNLEDSTVEVYISLLQDKHCSKMLLAIVVSL